MTGEEPETVQPDGHDRSTAPVGSEELWLTYLNYDPAIQQAVRRLGALSARNVEEFRSLLLKGRDRSRIKEYEAESIRRLQGEAFVGDEELQRTLIVLHAEDSQLAEDFKAFVAKTGKPAELDQAVAAVRAGRQAPPEQPAPATRREAVTLKVVASRPDTPLPPPPAASQAVAQPAAEQVASEQLAPEQPAPEQKDTSLPRRLTPLLLLAAGVAVVVLVFVTWRLIPHREIRPPASPQVRSAPPALRVASQPTSTAATEAAAPAAAVPAIVEAQPSQKQAEAKSPPPARDAAPSAQEARANPVPGAYYKVVRGDMLTDIALRAYRDAHKFVLIQKANPDLRHGPNLILTDQTLYIPPDNPPAP